MSYLYSSEWFMKGVEGGGGLIGHSLHATHLLEGGDVGIPCGIEEGKKKTAYKYHTGSSPPLFSVPDL